MKRQIVCITAAIFIIATTPAIAMQGHDGHGSGSGHDMHSGENMDHGAHGSKMDHSAMAGTFKYAATQGGIEAEFQVMSLASMNMTSDEGDTHHIMVNLKEVDTGAPIKEAVGKIKVIAPDETEQVSPLKNYNGILAANFTFKESGKYGVICLLKNRDKKEVFKFWYHHM